MKKLLFIFTLFTSQFFAQINPRTTFWPENADIMDYQDAFDMTYSTYNFMHLPQQIRKDHQIEKVRTTFTNKKGKTSYVINSFNHFGRLVYTSSPKRKYTYVAQFQDDSLLTFSERHSKKSVKTARYSYDGTKITSCIIEKNGKLQKRILVNYTDFGKRKQIINQFPKEKRNSEMNYFYSEDQKHVKTELLKHGKLKKRWVYTCQPKGDDISGLKEDQIAQYCTYNAENNDGSYSVFKRSIIDGKNYLEERKFRKDSVLFEILYFKNDSLLTQKNELYKDSTVIINYKKGKEKTRYHYSYKDQQIKSFYSFHKRQLQYGYVFIYNENGQKIARKGFKKAINNETYRYEYTYNKLGLIETEKSFSKGKFVFSKEYEYTQF